MQGEQHRRLAAALMVGMLLMILRITPMAAMAGRAVAFPAERRIIPKYTLPETEGLTVQTELLLAGMYTIPELVKVLPPANLENLPANCTPVAVAVAVFIKAGHSMAKAALEAEATAEAPFMVCVLPREKPTLAAVVVAGAAVRRGLTVMEQTAEAASCASGYTRKTNNKLKGERLCTTS